MTTIRVDDVALHVDLPGWEAWMAGRGLPLLRLGLTGQAAGEEFDELLLSVADPHPVLDALEAGDVLGNGTSR